MLNFLDVVLTVVHLSIILFNLFGWIPVKWRKAHLICVLLTAGSWLLLAPWFGLGYCPFTDWQWQVKEKLGETNLPANFVEYFAEKISGKEFSYEFINLVIMVCFSFVAILSVYLNIKGRRNG